MINVREPIVWRLQPVVPLPWACFHSHVPIVRVVRRKVATSTVVGVRWLKNSWPIVLKIFRRVVTIRLSIVEFHRWHMASVSVNSSTSPSWFMREICHVTLPFLASVNLLVSLNSPQQTPFAMLIKKVSFCLKILASAIAYRDGWPLARKLTCMLIICSFISVNEQSINCITL